MKKILICVLLCTMIFSLFSCESEPGTSGESGGTVTDGNNGTTSSTEEAGSATPEEEESTTQKPTKPGTCEHVMGEATCTAAPRCTLCSRPFGIPLGHDYSLEIAACTRCGREDPLAKKEDGIVRIVCAGDSITAGKSWWFGNMMGRLDDTYEVQGYGVSGATGLADGIDQDQIWGYVTHEEYQQALRSAPDIVVIMLGTNDTKPVNSDRIYADGGEQYKKDMTAMIEAFKATKYHPEIYIALSPTIYRTKDQGSGMNDPDLVNLIFPLLYEVAEETGCQIIDVHTPTQNHKELFSDGVHPGDEGRAIIAETIANAILADAPHKPEDNGEQA